MMTGTYPSTHGSGSCNETLPDSIPTVAERLSKAGYHTVGLSSNPYFSSTTGMDRGFDTFEFMTESELFREAGLRSLLSFARNLRRFSAGLEFDKRKHDGNFLMNEVVKNRLRTQAQRDEPFFLTAHYSGVHHPYYPSPVFQKKFADDLSMAPKEAAKLAFEHTSDVYSSIATGPTSDGSTEEVVRTMYDAQLAQIDELISEVLQHVERLGLTENTILVITSDHGDLLGELGLLSHKLVVHDSLIRVPIAVLGSDYLAEADLTLAQHGDIMETILAELSVDTTGMQGVRLDERAREEAFAQRGAETYDTTMDEVRSYNPDFTHEHVLPGFVTAMRTEEWKYVSGADSEVLYTLPAEDEDVATEHPETAKRFRGRLKEWLATHGDTVRSDGVAEFDDDVRERLADLGYVE